MSLQRSNTSPDASLKYKIKLIKFNNLLNLTISLQSSSWKYIFFCQNFAKLILFLLTGLCMTGRDTKKNVQKEKKRE